MKSTVHGLVAIDTAPVIVNEITLVGSRCGRFEPALRLLKSGKVRWMRMISEVLPLKDARRAFREAAKPGSIEGAVACLELPAAMRQPFLSLHAQTPEYGYQVVHAYPHDPNAFTEGLEFRAGFLYESTGLKGHSSLRKEKLETGKVLQQIDLDPQYFGEGITVLNQQIVQLTWHYRNRICV